MIEQQEEIRSAKAARVVSLRIPATDLVLEVWRRRYGLVIFTVIGIALSIAWALSIEPEFLSTAKLMPVNPKSLTSSSSLDMMDAVQGMLGESSFLSQATPGATAIGILESRTELDSIVTKLKLKESFNAKTIGDARNRLSGMSTFSEDKTSGIVSIRVLDTDRVRAQQIAQAYIDVLNELIGNLNSSSAHRERVFLEERLKSVKGNLDATAALLSQFSSHNATLNPETQGQALIVSVTQLQAQLIAARSDLQELKAKYSPDNIRVRAAQARIAELDRQISNITAPETRDSHSASNARVSYPSLLQLPGLGVTYTELVRQLATEQAVYETLSKQYEMAKVQEAKELPVVRVLDQPDLAEKKFSPHRSIIVLFGMTLFFFAGVSWICARKLWIDMGDSAPIKMAISRIKREVFTKETPAP